MKNKTEILYGFYYKEWKVENQMKCQIANTKAEIKNLFSYVSIVSQPHLVGQDLVVVVYLYCK